MAVAIRLQRIGKPKQPFYRIVATDLRRPAQGKPIEILGSYNPRAEKAKDKIEIKLERYEYWVGVGARPSETVASLVKARSKAGSTADEAAIEKKAEAEVVAEEKAEPKTEVKPEAEEKAEAAPEEKAEAAPEEKAEPAPEEKAG